MVLVCLDSSGFGTDRQTKMAISTQARVKGVEKRTARGQAVQIYVKRGNSVRR